MNTLGKKGGRKVPQSVKTNRKIKAVVEKAIADNRHFSDGEITLKQLDPQKLAEARTAIFQAMQTMNKPSLLVANKSKSWVWFSNIAFALIVAVQAFFETVPPELIATLPSDAQSKITMALAILGVIGRFINQSRQPKTIISVGDK